MVALLQGNRRKPRRRRPQAQLFKNQHQMVTRLVIGRPPGSIDRHQ
jgi:hypothetical protein